MLVWKRTINTRRAVMPIKIILPGRTVNPNSLTRNSALERKSRKPSSSVVVALG